MAKKTAAKARPRQGQGGAADQQQPEAAQKGPTSEERLAAFSARYQSYLIVALVAAIVIVVVLAVKSNRSSKRRRDSLEAFDNAATVEAYDAVADRYGGTFVGARALVEAGDLLYEQGDYAEARRRYEAYLETDPDPALAMLAWTDIVQTYIAEKDYAGGITACEAALGSEAIGPEARELAERQILYYTAYCYELSGDIDSAEEWYKKLTEGEEAGGPWTLLADRRLADVQRRTDTQPGNGPPGTGNGPKNPEKDIDTPGND